jgi:Cd2+/Zn2+-exporting ATPase
VRADGAEELVDPAQLVPGDTLRIRPGENVLADGEIVRGATALREATITGESLPVDKSVGDGVFGGTVNLSGAIEVRVTRAGEDTTLGKVRQLILAAEKTRLPVVRLIDRYVRYYTPIVLIVAAMFWMFTGDVDRLVSLFIVACPVALFLATPSAMVAALSAAARVGILIKNVSDLEQAARLDAFVFDKTGTLTSGQLSVARLSPAEDVESADLLRLVACAEHQSNHPVAQAVTALARRARVPLLPPDDLHEEPGRGIRATVEGRALVVGNRAWMEANSVPMARFPDLDEDAGGMSVLFAACDGRPLGWIGLKDEPREEAADAVVQLRRRGIGHVALITGDRIDVAGKIASELHIPAWRGECVPADKVAYVREIREQGRRVAFVGDGVNDGPALAASHLGIALGAAGSDVAIESAAIALMNNDLRRLPFLIDLSRASRRAIIQNFILGGMIIGGGAFLSGLGALSPVLAAVLQILGAVGVVMNSARLIRQGEHVG